MVLMISIQFRYSNPPLECPLLLSHPVAAKFAVGSLCLASPPFTGGDGAGMTGGFMSGEGALRYFTRSPFSYTAKNA